MDSFKKIDSHNCIFLTHIEEPEENTLHLIIQEGILSDEETTWEIGDAKLEGVKEISITGKSCAYEVSFDSYIAYSVLNESYTEWDDYDSFDGKLFRIYQKSRFLDYLKLASFASEEFPGPFIHYGFCCVNHIVNIASLNEPSIKQLRGT